MKAIKKINPEALIHFKKVVPDFTEGTADLKLELIQKISRMRFNSVSQILQLHDAYLFLSAYSQNQKLSEEAQIQLNSLTEQIIDNSIREKLSGTGLAGTSTCGAFSLTLTKWLIKNYPGTVIFHSFGEGTHPREILKQAIPEMEFEISSDEDSKPEKWLIKLLGTKDREQLLIGLVENISNINASPLITEQLYESMQVFVEIKPVDQLFSRSFGKIDVKEKFYHAGQLLKKFDEQELIHRKLPKEKKLNFLQKTKILNASKIALVLLNRETDPITYCEPDLYQRKGSDEGFKFYELEHGLSIALFSICAERRLPLESYIGFMMFKNGYPMSYGGAWLFGKRALIGINIFEAFRGGESAFVFAQLLRCYSKAFGATYFEVEPYQFGKHNPEGISSGAFWFYHRFGFRPLDKKLNELAEQEHQLILSQKGYRTSPTVLKKFTASNMFVNFKDEVRPVNPSEISKFITERINKLYKGNRSHASQSATRFLKGKGIVQNATNRTGYGKLNLFIFFCLDHQKLGKSECTELKSLISAKSASEFEYIRILNKMKAERLLNQACKEFCSLS